MKLNRSIDNLAKRLNRLEPLLPNSPVPSNNNRTGLGHWKAKPVIALKDWIQILGQLPSRLDYFPDDFGIPLTGSLVLMSDTVKIFLINILED